jgi:hypothetical protein
MKRYTVDFVVVQYFFVWFFELYSSHHQINALVDNVFLA